MLVGSLARCFAVSAAAPENKNRWRLRLRRGLRDAANCEYGTKAADEAMQSTIRPWLRETAADRGASFGLRRAPIKAATTLLPSAIIKYTSKTAKAEYNCTFKVLAARLAARLVDFMLARITKCTRSIIVTVIACALMHLADAHFRRARTCVCVCAAHK